MASGLRGLRAVSKCVVEGPPTLAGSGRWLVRLSLQIQAAGEFVPALTRWCMLVDQAYPGGPIELYPAAHEGIAVTFPHQERNEPDDDGRGWRRGKLCLDSPFRVDRHATVVRDPFGDAEARLRWHAERAVQWLEAAASGQLVAVGIPSSFLHARSGPSRRGSTAALFTMRRLHP